MVVSVFNRPLTTSNDHNFPFLRAIVGISFLFLSYAFGFRSFSLQRFFFSFTYIVRSSPNKRNNSIKTLNIPEWIHRIFHKILSHTALWIVKGKKKQKMFFKRNWTTKHFAHTYLKPTNWWDMRRTVNFF